MLTKKKFKNKKIIISIIFLLLSLLITQNLFYSNNCKKNSTSVIFQSIKSFGIEHYFLCYSVKNLKLNLKRYLSKNTTIYNYFSNRNNKSNWFSPFNQDDLIYVEQQKKKKKILQNHL